MSSALAIDAFFASRTPAELAEFFLGEGAVSDGVPGRHDLDHLWPCVGTRYIRVAEPDRVQLWLRPGLAGADRDEAIECAVREYLGLGPKEGGPR